MILKASAFYIARNSITFRHDSPNSQKLKVISITLSPMNLVLIAKKSLFCFIFCLLQFNIGIFFLFQFLLSKFIKAKEYRYTAPYQAHSLKPIKIGG